MPEERGPRYPTKPVKAGEQRPLTPREKKFLMLLPQCKTKLEAALRAGYPKASAGVQASKFMASANAQEAIREALAESGVTIEDIAESFRAGLDARQYALHQSSGKPVEMGPDWHARAKVLDTLGKMAGLYPDPRLEVSGPGGGAIVVRHTRNLDGIPESYSAKVETVDAEVRELDGSPGNPSQSGKAVLETLSAHVGSALKSLGSPE